MFDESQQHEAERRTIRQHRRLLTQLHEFPNKEAFFVACTEASLLVAKVARRHQKEILAKANRWDRRDERNGAPTDNLRLAESTLRKLAVFQPLINSTVPAFSRSLHGDDYEIDMIGTFPEGVAFPDEPGIVQEELFSTGERCLCMGISTAVYLCLMQILRKDYPAANRIVKMALLVGDINTATAMFQNNRAFLRQRGIKPVPIGEIDLFTQQQPNPEL